MTYEEIRKFIIQKDPGSSPVQINFKTRRSLKGVFLHLPDYDELSRKNLWRIVSESYIDSYQATKDVNLARIFNGAEITKLEKL
jgi:hypothetical protein